MGDNRGTTQSTPEPDITGLLHAWTGGQRAALDRLIELTYPELRNIALRYFRQENAGHTLQCTALINEAYLRLVQSPEKQWENRSHFFGFAARLMRSILVDHARAKQTLKRGGGVTIKVDDTDIPSGGSPVGVLDLNSALDELEKFDELQSRIVELKYFGGLTIEEMVDVTGISASSLKREWVIAKTWIRRRLIEGHVEDGG